MSGIVYGCITPHPPIMVPQIGKGREAEVSNSIEAMGRIGEDLAKAQPDTVCVVSPHGAGFPYAMGVVSAPSSRGTLARWGGPEIDYSFANDLDMAEAILDEATASDLPVRRIEDAEYPLDHGVMVPAYFLIDELRSRTLIPLSFSSLPLEEHFEFGRTVAKAAKKTGKRVAFLASGDLSHRLLPDAPAGYDPIGHEFDSRVKEAVASLDSDALVNMDSDLISKAGECGLRSIVMLMGALAEEEVESEVLSYEGPFGVGYLTASLRPKQKSTVGLGPSLVKLAREAVEQYVRDGSVAAGSVELEDEMRQKAGVFVTIRRCGELRGCIGTAAPAKDNLRDEVVANAIGAATRDPRFPRVSLDELLDLEYSVSLLTPMEPIDGPEDLDPAKYGLVVRKGSRSGLLLPGIRQVKTPAQQIGICNRESGHRAR